MNNPSRNAMEVPAMHNTVMKDAVKAIHVFTSDEAMRCQYMRRERSTAEIGDRLQQSRKTWM